MVVRWGILGAAEIARKEFLPAMRACDSGRVVALATRDPSRGAQFCETWGIDRLHVSYDALLSNPQVDAVYVPLPNHLHVEMSTRALEAGKHVLCEKPIGLSAETIAPLTALRDRTGLVAAEAFMVAYHPQWDQVRAWIDAGQIGALRHIEGSFTYLNIDPANIRNQSGLGGGALLDVGVYPVVTSRIVLGQEPQAVSCRIDTDPTFGTDRVATGIVEFGPVTLSFYVATQLAGRQAMIFHGTEGLIEMEMPFNPRDERTRVFLRRASGEDQEVAFTDVDQFRRQADAFARAVAGENHAVFALESSVANQRVIDALLRAARSGRRETV